MVPTHRECVDVNKGENYIYAILHFIFIVYYINYILYIYIYEMQNNNC